MIIWSSINFPTLICLPIVCYFSREKPLVKPTAPGSSFSYIALRSTFPLRFYSDLLNQKIQKYLAAIYFYLFCLAFDLSIYYNFLTSVCLSWGAVPRKGLTTPLTRRVARCCYLCAGVAYVCLLGSPTGSIPWFHNWGKYLPLLCYIILSSWGKYRRNPSDTIK